MVRKILWPKIDFRVPQTPGRVPIGSVGMMMRLQHFGCKNRPIFHIQVTKEKFPHWRYISPIEQVGIYDPCVNEHGEKLVSLNIERIQHFLAKGIKLDVNVAMLLGLAGLLPQHPRTYMTAWRNREELSVQEQLKEVEEEEGEKAEN